MPYEPIISHLKHWMDLTFLLCISYKLKRGVCVREGESVIERDGEKESENVFVCVSE